MQRKNGGVTMNQDEFYRYIKSSMLVGGIIGAVSMFVVCISIFCFLYL